MGVCNNSKEVLDQRAQARAIEKQLKEEKTALAICYRLLLLGTGDSGKSTFCKQMRLLHDDGFTEREFFTHKTVLQENALHHMQALLRAAQDKVDFGDLNYQEVLKSKDLTPKIAEIISKLWDLPAVQNIYLSGCNLHLSSATEYYFQHVQRFASDTFIPNPSDLLRARAKTTGISEIKFVRKNVEFAMIDVGGQRSERRKWLHCFDNVSCVIYLSAIDEYDLFLQEDDKTNRLEESLNLFREVSGSPLFRDTPFVLFLNKIDIFEKKIKSVPLNYFKDFNGKPEEAKEFIKKKFEESFNGKSLYVHYTCAVDSDNCLKVFDSLQDNLLRELVTPSMQGGFV